MRRNSFKRAFLACAIAMTPACVKRAMAPPPGEEGEARAAPCADDLASCTEIGCAKQDTPAASFNMLKRTKTDDQGQPITFASSKQITIAMLGQLQASAHDRVGKKAISAADHAKLVNLDAGGAQFSEGNAVRIAGYIVSDPRHGSGTAHPNTQESVNCNLTGVSNNDFHIPIADSANQTECDGAVTEMIPQDRPDAWNISSLQKMADDGQLVMFVGRLFYDNFHDPDTDCSSRGHGDPKRLSVWEVHPVTEFYACAADACSVDQVDGWQMVQ
jgi:hypothetical protein